MVLHSLGDLFFNHAMMCALIGWFFAQALKVPLHFLVEHTWDLRRFFGSGGMPSSHSAMVVSLAIMTGALNGFHTGLFAVSLVLAMIVMYDAAGVRRETGNQGKVINQILKDILIDGKQISDEQLKELVGHTPLEVLGGAMVGLLVSVAYLVALGRT